MPGVTLTEADLYSTCPACEGTGRPPLQPPPVHGTPGPGPAVEYRVRCQACDGAGVTLTPTGRVVANFVKLVQLKNL